MDGNQLLNKCFTINEKQFVVRGGLKQWQQIMTSLKNIDLTQYNKLVSQDITEDEQVSLLFQLISELVKEGVMPEVLSFILKPAESKWNEQDAASVRGYFEEDGEEIIPQVLMAFFLSKTELIKKITQGSQSFLNSKKE